MTPKRNTQPADPRDQVCRLVLCLAHVERAVHAGDLTYVRLELSMALEYIEAQVPRTLQYYREMLGTANTEQEEAK